jgi:hypothetical protein
MARTIINDETNMTFTYTTVSLLPRLGTDGEGPALRPNLPNWALPGWRAIKEDAEVYFFSFSLSSALF